MKIWRLKHGADRRIRSGHPWVFSNEISESPKGLEPGTPIILQDAKGSFVAAGYGNPMSLICFRATTFDFAVKEPTGLSFLQSKLIKAWEIRHSLGFNNSFRLCFGENDFLPGLVIDRYLTAKGQVFALQILTAGIAKALTDVESFFEDLVAESINKKISQVSWQQTSIVLRNDVSVRKLEGLSFDEPKIIRQAADVSLNECEISLNNETTMWVDLFHGQKTGFFLDQSENIEILCSQLVKSKNVLPKKIKILDLCCYVGQWSTQISKTLKAFGIECEVSLIDVSKDALSLAKKNVQKEGATVETIELDVVQDLQKLTERNYDIVIADPPAFIKAKKDIHTGKHAYLKLNTQAFRLAKNGGFVVSCSCSGLFEEIELVDVLRKSIQRDGRAIRCIAKGGHAADHPVVMSFPEGLYLKMFLHKIEG